ncbi:hypothetical protein B0H16DRAFT_1746108 [Mycena metata]|uniref:Uncharacterized protein n=1 Tax=Mycena metata TaxID=1033252 RepID=A0AAD7H018_9AGAR|nr:hypothetical protein B0H16DRAFT_1746108 [Mycena metata]
MVETMAGAQFELAEMRSSEYPAATDKYMGAFVNYATESFGLWLLAVGIPVFFAHAYHPHELRRRTSTHSSAFSNFVDGTELVDLLGASSNGFEHLESRLSLPITNKVTNLGLGVDHTVQDNDARFSSSLFLEIYSKARVSGTELPTELCWDPRYMPRPLELVDVAAGRHQWVRPPRVEELKGKGKWEKWEECSDSEGEDVELRIVKRALSWRTDKPLMVRYDREKRRELYLRPNRVEQRGVVRADQFGWPAPRIGYWERTNDGVKPRGPSYWVYAARDPPRSLIGMVPATPPPDELPLLHSSPTPPAMDIDDEDDVDLDFDTLPPIAPGGPTGEEPSYSAPPPPSSTSSNEKMQVDPPPVTATQLEKGKRKQMNEEVDRDVDAVSLGPASDGEEDPPISVLRIRGLQDGVGVLQLARLLGAVFKEAGVGEVNAVLDAQRSMWVELWSLKEGSEVEIEFVTVEEFEDAAKYTDAIWHPGLAEDVPAAEARTSETEAPEKLDNFQHWVPYTRPSYVSQFGNELRSPALSAHVFRAPSRLSVSSVPCSPFAQVSCEASIRLVSFSFSRATTPVPLTAAVLALQVTSVRAPPPFLGAEVLLAPSTDALSLAWASQPLELAEVSPPFKIAFTLPLSFSFPVLRKEETTVANSFQESFYLSFV